MGYYKLFTLCCFRLFDPKLFSIIRPLAIITYYTEYIHGYGTKKKNSQKRTTKNSFRFLLHLLFHDYDGLVYDFNCNDAMLI